MQSSFDTRAASFNPDQTAVLSEAYRLAVQAFGCEQRVPSSTKSKLAKVVVNLGRERLRHRRTLDAREISERAAEFITHLREPLSH